MKKYIIALLLFFCKQERSIAQRNKDINGGEKQAGIFHTDIPSQTYNIILSRPTDNSITISILSNENLEGYIAYGINADKLVNKTSKVRFIKGQTTALEIDHLAANKSYYYKFLYTAEHSMEQTASPLNRFQTQRSPKTGFTFTVQADSHLDENAGTDMYLKTLSNMAADSADFLIDLGDTWMTDKYHPDYKESLKQYIAQRYYFGSLCKSSSLFLTLGNHDGESGQKLKKKNDDNMTAWATDTRKKYYFNPFPNGFYSGNDARENNNDARENNVEDVENYYAWEWGNALFVVLDPFRFSTANKDPWQRTLGLRQYNWLKSILEKSKASFKFVFIHNLVGGVDLKGRARGGSEASKFFEWGGLDSAGENRFAENRPGWEKPIHDLLVTNHVNILFHGHDHFFAKQDRDGLIYQLVPQPGALRYGNTNSAAEYGYTEGKILNGPGYMRIKIEEKKATVELVQTSIDASRKNKEILFTYTLPAE